MASSYTGLGTELMTTGENAGTWGTTTNTNLQIIEQISGGFTEQAVTTTTTLSVSDGSAGAELAHRVIEFTGTMSANSTVTVPLDVQQMYILKNSTASSGHTLTFKYVSGSGSTVAFAATDKGTKIVYATANHATNPDMVDTGISTNTLTGVTGDITVDSPADIILDADGADVILKDGGTQYGTLTNSSSNLLIKSGSTTAATFSGANVTFAGTIGSGAVTSTGIVTGTGFTAGSAVLAEAELELLDGLTAGTAIASKVVTTDSSIDTTGQRNLTISGELDAATLDISGNADIDGTTNLDAVDIDGAVQIDGAVTVGVDDTGLDVKLFGAAAGAYGLYDQSENAFEVRGATAAGAGLLKLTTGELTVVDADKLGRIDFQAPLESDGTDAVAIAASIWAEADDTFSTSVNNTDLVFALGKSEAAAEKFRFTADNEIGIAGANYGTDGQVLTSGGAGAAVAWETVAGGLTGKVEGTNFVDSLIVGHSTTGTLDNALRNTIVGIDAGDATTTADDNTIVGYQAGTAITSGGFNVLVGKNAGATDSTGYGNTGVGKDSLYTGNSNYNTALGHQASYYTTGTLNVAIGAGAGAGSTSASSSYNTFIGKDAGNAITTGGYNVVVGYDGGDNLTTGSGNILLGTGDFAAADSARTLKIVSYDGTTTINHLSGDSSGILSIGGNAASQAILKFYEDSDNGSNYIAIQSPAANVAGADYTLTLPELTAELVPGKFEGTDFANSLMVGHATTGSGDSQSDTGVGIEALDALTTGGNCVAVGYRAGTAISSGVMNTAIGSNALKSLTTSSNNTGIGAYALTVVTGGNNTAMGQDALKAVTSGAYNIGIGRDSGDNLIDGSGNIIIGSADTAATDSARTLKITSYDGSTTTNHMIGDSSGNQIFAGTATAAGGQLTTTGKALVMGF